MVLISSFLLVGCDRNNQVNEVEDVLVYEITNMNQLPFDMTNLKAIEVEVTKTMFLSNVVSPSKENFNLELEGTNITSIDHEYVFVGENIHGAKVYENKELDTNFITTYIEGGLQVLYEMKSEKSPKEFKLNIELNKGSELVKTENGDYVIKDKNGNIDILLGQAWAVDSNGDFVETYYEINGNVISQVIDYDGSNYPVKADPLFCTNTIDNGKTTWDSSYGGGQGTLSVYPTTCAKIYLAAMVLYPGSLLLISPFLLIESVSVVADMYEEMVGDYSYQTHVASWQEDRIADQFACHAFNPVVQLLQKYQWNLEPWRPDVGFPATVAALCNP